MLYKAEVKTFAHWPKALRWLVGWTTIVLFTCAFLVLPISACLLPTLYYYGYMRAATVWVGLLVLSLLTPQTEWPAARTIGELWYEIFDFHSNLSPEDRKRRIEEGQNSKYIIAMHPHGVIPFHAWLWAAYCHQYLNDKNGKQLYGFGAGADVVMAIPFLRQAMGWLTAGSASYSALKEGIEHGICPAANRAGRHPTSLYILPGGVAEIFESRPNENAIVFKNRFGLARLSLETGAMLIPTYVFGATDFFGNPIHSDSAIAWLSRKMRTGLCLFYGPLIVPFIPFTPKVTLVVGEPLEVKKYTGKGKPPREMIAELHSRYLVAITKLFDAHKAECGYPDGKLLIN